MNLVCAWCGGSIERHGYSQLDNNTSHGMCPECSSALSFQEDGVPLQHHIDSIPIPIILLDSNNAIVATNAKACEMLGRKPEATVNRPFGTVFDCVYSRVPEECGRRIHCSGCVIRNSVTTTYNTGAPQVSVPATLSVESPDRFSEAVLTVTTVKSAGLVVMRIEQIVKNPNYAQNPSMSEIA
jgi:transcriptional regulator with PAS, ATPase and Fis domain